MRDDGTIKLNIGAGRTRIPGFTNVDSSRRADISLNLSDTALPFDDDSIDLVFSYHTLERIPDFLFALGEIHRVLKSGAILLAGFPYVTSTEYHQVNPYHLHNFNEYSFDFFDPKLLKGSAAENDGITFHKIFHRYHYAGHFGLAPAPLRNWCRRHLFNVVTRIDFGLTAVKHSEVEVASFDASALESVFDEVLASRIPYDSTT